MMPQWDFLNFLAGAGGTVSRRSACAWRRRSPASSRRDGRVVGVRGAPRRQLEIAPTCVIGADGRHSTVRARAGLEVENPARRSTCCGFGCRARRAIPRTAWGASTPGRDLRAASTAATTGSAATSSRRAAPTSCAARVCRRSARRSCGLLPLDRRPRRPSIAHWDAGQAADGADRPPEAAGGGRACFASAMRPRHVAGGRSRDQHRDPGCGGRENILSAGGGLQEIQKRRAMAGAGHGLQILKQDRVICPLLSGQNPVKPPLFLRLAHRFPGLRRLPGRLIGMGVRPERLDN